MPVVEDKEILDKLLTNNGEFRQLFEEHKTLEAKVEKLFDRQSSNPADDLELQRLKKLKLQGKDRMRRIIEES